MFALTHNFVSKLSRNPDLVEFMGAEPTELESEKSIRRLKAKNGICILVCVLRG
jgi:hypothetical protein